MNRFSLFIALLLALGAHRARGAQSSPAGGGAHAKGSSHQPAHDEASDDDDDDSDGDGAQVGPPQKSEMEEKDDEVPDPDELAANVTLASDYILRGISQTERQPSIQGGFDWNHPLGIYLGTWASNVKFPDFQSSIELDGFAGYICKLDKDWNVSGQILYYSYFGGNSDLNSWDFSARTEKDAFQGEIHFSPGWKGAGASWYFMAGLREEVAYEVKLGLFVGYSVFTGDVDTSDYADFRLSVSREFLGVEWDVSGYFAPPSEDVNGIGSAGARLVVSVAKNF